MLYPFAPSRRRLLRRAAAISALLVPAGILLAAPMVLESDPAAKALSYVGDAKKSKTAAGNNCASCALFQGAAAATQGPCQLFPGKLVAAAGWCSSWAPQM